jgi:hypothetical protein
MMVIDRLNLRPRKCADFKTPYKVYFGHHSAGLTIRIQVELISGQNSMMRKRYIE